MDSDSGETSTHALSASSSSIVPHCGDIPTTFFGDPENNPFIKKRGFSFRWLRLVLRGCDGARVTPGVAKSCAEGEKGGSPFDTRIRGRNIHRLLLRRSKHRKQVREIAQQRKKRKFKLGWISRLL